MNVQNMKDEFRNYTFDNCRKLFEQEYLTVARVVDIYDGDTCTIVMKFNDVYNKFTVRLNGIDTCEMKAKSADNKRKAYLARDRLYTLITNDAIPNNSIPRKMIRDVLNREVYLINLCVTGTDKYGRLLADLYGLEDVSKTRSFSSVLLTEKLAYSYDGGTKKTEEEQLD